MNSVEQLNPGQFDLILKSYDTLFRCWTPEWLAHVCTIWEDLKAWAAQRRADNANLPEAEHFRSIFPNLTILDIASYAISRQERGLKARPAIQVLTFLWLRCGLKVDMKNGLLQGFLKEETVRRGPKVAAHPSAELTHTQVACMDENDEAYKLADSTRSSFTILMGQLGLRFGHMQSLIYIGCDENGIFRFKVWKQKRKGTSADEDYIEVHCSKFALFDHKNWWKPFVTAFERMPGRDFAFANVAGEGTDKAVMCAHNNYVVWSRKILGQARFNVPRSVRDSSTPHGWRRARNGQAAAVGYPVSDRALLGFWNIKNADMPRHYDDAALHRQVQIRAHVEVVLRQYLGISPDNYLHGQFSCANLPDGVLDRIHGFALSLFSNWCFEHRVIGSATVPVDTNTTAQSDWVFGEYPETEGEEADDLEDLGCDEPQFDECSSVPSPQKVRRARTTGVGAAAKASDPQATPEAKGANSGKPSGIGPAMGQQLPAEKESGVSLKRTSSSVAVCAGINCNVTLTEELQKNSSAAGLCPACAPSTKARKGADGEKQPPAQTSKVTSPTQTVVATAGVGAVRRPAADNPAPPPAAPKASTGKQIDKFRQRRQFDDGTLAYRVGSLAVPKKFRPIPGWKARVLKRGFSFIRVKEQGAVPQKFLNNRFWYKVEWKLQSGVRYALLPEKVAARRESTDIWINDSSKMECLFWKGPLEQIVNGIKVTYLPRWQIFGKMEYRDMQYVQFGGEGTTAEAAQSVTTEGAARSKEPPAASSSGPAGKSM